MRLILEMEVAGARSIFGEICFQRADMAQIALTGLATNQGAGMRVLEARNSDSQRLARDRRGIGSVVHKLSEPF